MRPVRTVQQGEIEPLPELHHAAGPLDALLWAGGDGLAVAQFGTRGGFYRPEHDDPNPTFAIVDARRGIVLDTLPFDAIEPLRGRNRQAAQYILIPKQNGVRVMAGIKIREIDLTGGRGSGQQGAPGVRPTEKDLTGGQRGGEGAPGVKTTEKDLTKQRTDKAK
jgi:hypothetical protein